jgi:hypothetical protein
MIITHLAPPPPSHSPLSNAIAVDWLSLSKRRRRDAPQAGQSRKHLRDANLKGRPERDHPQASGTFLGNKHYLHDQTVKLRARTQIARAKHAPAHEPKFANTTNAGRVGKSKAIRQMYTPAE